jgi:hypothetical protein
MYQFRKSKIHQLLLQVGGLFMPQEKVQDLSFSNSQNLFIVQALGFCLSLILIPDQLDSGFVIINRASQK